MNIQELIPSKYVAASDLRGQDVQVVIARVALEEVGMEAKEKKGVVHFQGMTKGMVLNRTNIKRIAKMYGGETNNWIGKTITLYPSETEMKGETVPCIRVRDMAVQAILAATEPAPVAIPAPVVQPVTQPVGAPVF
ncbi:MAG: hypothetical protein QM811_06855 [Pirellulales bacterium]